MQIARYLLITSVLWVANGCSNGAESCTTGCGGISAQSSGGALHGGATGVSGSSSQAGGTVGSTSGGTSAGGSVGSGGVNGGTTGASGANSSSGGSSNAGSAGMMIGGSSGTSGGNTSIGGTTSAMGGTTSAMGGMNTSGGMVSDGGTSTMCMSSNPVQQSFKVGLTYYQKTATGTNCGVPWPSDGMYLALSTDLYDKPSGSSACGKCIQVTGTSGITKTLLVVDQCPANTNPPCTSTHLDLSPQAFNAVQGSMNPGQVSNGQLNAKFVPCPVTGNIVYHVKSVQAYYAAFVIMNSRYGIKSVSYRAAGGSGWTPMTAPTDADPHWVINGVAPPAAMDLEITSEWGQVVRDKNVMLKEGDVNGMVQFPACQ